MANPSLQIGNSNWAIKKDNLLGYSTAGTRFLPIPITMTRASAGTRVNPQGLVETVDLVVGAEFIDNTNFETDTDWGGSYAINTVIQQLTKTSSGLAYQIDGGIIAGKSYKIVVDVASLDGTTTIWLAGNNYNLSVGIQTIYAIGGTNSFGGGRLAINNGYSSGAGTVFNSISVKEAIINDLARVDYTGSTSSLLAEPQRTNLLPYSEDLSQWSLKQATETLNYGISPDGTQNSTRLVFASGNLQFSNIFTTVTPTTGSIYMKGIVGETVSFGMQSSEGLFTFDGSWQRFERIGTATSNKITVNTYNSATARDFEVWGGQVEEGSYATSYIPTSGSTVTRVQDQYSKTGISDKINSAEGVLFVEMAALSDDLTYRIISLSDGTDAERLYIQYTSTTNQVSAVLKTGSSTQANIQHTLTDETLFSKMAFKWKANDFAFWIDGVEVGTDTSGSVPSGLNRLALDRQLNTNTFFGKVKQLQVYKTALTDEQLIQLTGTSGTDFYESYAEMASALTYTIQ